MDEKTRRVAQELRSKISSKYNLSDFRVFGSRARGSQRSDSDIDIFVKLPDLNADIEADLFDMAYDLELSHDCLIDIVAMSDEDLKNNNKGGVPIYWNILSEGIAI